MTWPKRVGEAFIDEDGNMIGVTQKGADAFVLRFKEAMSSGAETIVIDSLRDPPVPPVARTRPRVADRSKSKAARQARRRQRKSRP